MDDSLISVIIPTYNRADLIIEAIESVLHQTYHNFELIIADDGSTDHTKEVVSAIRDSRIVYLSLHHSGLPAPPRNRGIETSKGDFIAFLDSDDLWLETKLEDTIVGFLHKPDVGIVCSNEYLLKDGIGKTTEKYVKSKNQNQLITFDKLFLGNIVSSSTAVVRRQCFDDVGTFDESPDFRATEDYHMWLRIASKFKILYLDQPLGYYRIHDGSIRLNQEKSLINLYNCLMDICSQYSTLIVPFKQEAGKRLQAIARAIFSYYVKEKNLKLATKWLICMLFAAPRMNP